MRKQSGFTLIELVVVIVILGILAAFAVPRFVGMQKEARTSTLKGLQGSIQGAAALAHGKALANNTYNPGDSLTVQGETIDMNGTWPDPTKEGIGDMIQDLSGFDATECASSPCTESQLSYENNGIEFYPNGASNKANCYVAYGTNGTGGNIYPVYDHNASDCS